MTRSLRSDSVSAQSETRPAQTGNVLIALWRELRPAQWIKNGLVFFALVYALKLTDPNLVARALLAFVTFCCLSSAGYVFNDLRDLPLDRAHPKKRHRPLASGALPEAAALPTVAALLAIAIPAALWLGPDFTATCLGYLALSAAYSAWWKHVVLIDLFCISGGFLLRAVAGAVAIQVPVSPWLYVCTVLGSLLIALGKRRGEAAEMPTSAQRPTLEQYSVAFLDRLIVLAAAASLMAYSLYTFSAENAPRNHMLMLTIPIVLYGVFRYLFLVQEQGLGDSPEELLVKDRSLAASVVLFVATSAAVLYLGPR